jgi:hypothetical protein
MAAMRMDLGLLARRQVKRQFAAKLSVPLPAVASGKLSLPRMPSAASGRVAGSL